MVDGTLVIASSILTIAVVNAVSERQELKMQLIANPNI